MVTKIVVDTDIGGNVDDAFALALAALDPRADLLGVTTVWSASFVRAQLARKVLIACGKGEVPVVAGASKPLLAPEPRHLPEQVSALTEADKAFSPPTDGIDFLRYRLRQESPQVTLVCLGPLTNLALALSVDPGLKGAIKSVVVMAGAVGMHYAETNIIRDPEAAHLVFSSGVPIILVDKSVTRHATIPQNLLERLSHCPMPHCRILWELTQIWRRTSGMTFPILNDPLAVAIALHPDIATTQKGRVFVELSGRRTRGYTLFEPEPEGNVQVCVEVNWSRFWRLIGEVLLRGEGIKIP